MVQEPFFCLFLDTIEKVATKDNENNTILLKKMLLRANMIIKRVLAKKWCFISGITWFWCASHGFGVYISFGSHMEHEHLQPP